MVATKKRLTEMVEGGKIGPVPGYVPIYPKSCKPEDQIAAMNAEELTEKIWNDSNNREGFRPDSYPGDRRTFRTFPPDPRRPS